ncbi:hypothetical protein MKX03_036868 [Papaver bracteatum]|nr:hypothetical protein MKX03_036868 [Papaver bracteatum]
MARTSVIFSLVFTGLIMLSISHMALGVSKLGQITPKVEPFALEGGNTEINLPEGEVKRGGTEDLTAVNGLTHVNKGGGVAVNLKKREVVQGPEYEHLEIADGAASVKRSSIVTVDLKKSQVTIGAKAEANIPGVANVNTGASIKVNVKNAKVTKTVPEAKKSNGNYK